MNHLVRSPRIRFESDQPEPRSTSVGELVQVYTIGNDICAISEISVGTHKGHEVTIYVRESDDWEIHTDYAN